MADFSEKLIQSTLKALKDDMGYLATRELAILELEDMKRKGCLLERADGYCIGCSAVANGGECPMNDWEKRHPEYANDELAMKIKVLEAGGEEAYKKKLEAQEAANKQKEEQDAQLKAVKDSIDHAVIKIRNEIEPNDEKSWWKELDEAIEAYVNLRIKYSKC